MTAFRHPQGGRGCLLKGVEGHISLWPLTKMSLTFSGSSVPPAMHVSAALTRRQGEPRNLLPWLLNPKTVERGVGAPPSGQHEPQWSCRGAALQGPGDSSTCVASAE